MDILKDSDRLPHFDQKIVVKVTRLSFGAVNQNHSPDASHPTEEQNTPKSPALPREPPTPDFSLL